MGNRVSWLYDQLGQWVARGLISAEQAAQIRDLYPAPRASRPWGLIVFSGLGAIVFGLGVVLLGAYNWHVVPKFGKLAIIFAILAAAHGSGLWLHARPDWRQHLGEAVCLLGSMFFGAGIWLIAQIYHIEEHFPSGFLIWGLGVLALGWALPSVAHGLLATVLLTVWGCLESWGFHTPMHGAPLVLLIGSTGLACRTRSPLLWFAATAGFLVTMGATAGAVHASMVLPVLVCTSALLVALHLMLRRQPWFTGSDWGWGLFGWLGFVLGVYLLSFSGVVEAHWQWWRYGAPDKHFAVLVAWYRGIPLALTLVAWLAVACFCRLTASPDGRPADCPWENWLLPISALLTQLLAFHYADVTKQGASAVFNLVLLALAVMWMARGCRAGRLRPMLLGSLMLVGLTVARYFDLFESLAVRGAVFVLVGGLLFAEGIFYRKSRRQAVPREDPE